MSDNNSLLVLSSSLLPLLLDKCNYADIVFSCLINFYRCVFVFLLKFAFLFLFYFCVVRVYFTVALKILRISPLSFFVFFA